MSISTIDISRLKAAIGRQLNAKHKQDKQRLDHFKDVKQSLKSKVLASFYRDELPSLKLINEAFEMNRGFPVPALSVCGHGTAEIRYTKLLAWYFDPRNPHGLQGLLAEAVFSPFFTEDDMPDFSKCVVEEEVYLGDSHTEKAGKTGNYLDILVTAGKWKICIEQKILSAEGKEQLTRYKKKIYERYSTNNNILLIYLTPIGKEGSESDWQPLSHKALINRMAEVLQSRLLYPVAQHNLRTLIWDLMLGPVAHDKTWMSRFANEVKLIVKKPDNNYPRFVKWLSSQNIERDERKSFLKIAEG